MSTKCKIFFLLHHSKRKVSHIIHIFIILQIIKFEPNQTKNIFITKHPTTLSFHHKKRRYRFTIVITNVQENTEKILKHFNFVQNCNNISNSFIKRTKDRSKTINKIFGNAKSMQAPFGYTNATKRS